MARVQAWLLTLAIIAACTCGVRTQCESRAQISFLTSVHDDPACKKLSAKGVLMYEAAKLLVEAHNNKSNLYDLELSILDTCGSTTGALKAAMKALVTADVNCLQPPHYLGMIGPERIRNAEAVHKVTSVLKVPHIVNERSASPYLHYLTKETNFYLVQATMKVLEALKWSTFRLIAKNNGDDEDDVQNTARKLTMAAVTNGLCVIVHDGSEEDRQTSHIVHIGKPEERFFEWTHNASVLIISEGSLEKYLNNVNSTNTLLLLEDSRNEFPGLEDRVERSSWWPTNEEAEKYNSEALREVRWLEDTIEMYSKTLDALCKRRKCKNQMNPLDWNNVLSDILENYNTDQQYSPKSLDLSIKTGDAELENLGNVIVRKSITRIYWNGQNSEGNGEESYPKPHSESHNELSEALEEEIPAAFRRILSDDKEVQTGCATPIKEISAVEEKEQGARILVSGMNDSEWWTMVGTVSGLGVAMFFFGILAVYVVYTNVRGPRSPKAKNRHERDNSLRRVSNDRELPVTVTRNQRANRGAQRRDSVRSVRSNGSERSV